MGPRKLRVYNRAREDFLSLEIAVVDTTAEPLKKLIEDLAVEGGGIWLTPYRGIPSAPGLPPSTWFIWMRTDGSRRRWNRIRAPKSSP